MYMYMYMYAYIYVYVYMYVYMPVYMCSAYIHALIYASTGPRTWHSQSRSALIPSHPASGSNKGFVAPAKTSSSVGM